MKVIKALFFRWLYLLCIGMWKGECAITETCGLKYLLISTSSGKVFYEVKGNKPQ